MSMKFRVLALLVALLPGVEGCVGNRGPSDVSQGKQYSSGNAEYDEFFSEVHQLQVALGKAPDRERVIRQQLSQALGLDGASRAEEIAAAVSKRVGQLGKPPARLKLEVSGLEAKGSPTSVMTTTGTISDQNDKAVATSIEQAGKDTATLLGDVRRSSAATDHLKAKAPALKAKVDATFGSTVRKGDVAKNLNDAEQMIPLMASRAAEIEERTLELLKKLEKSVNSPQGEIQPTKVNLEPPPPKKGKDKPKSGQPKTGGQAPPKQAPPKAEPKPQSGSEEAEAPKKAPPKPAPPPSDDFEP
jgi:hypothetical protein